MKNIKLSSADFTKSAHFNRVKRLLKSADVSGRDLLTQTVRALDNGIGGMEPGVKYATQDLFDTPAWASSRRGYKIALGLCLSYLVAHQLVPLVYANKPGDTNKLYELVSGVDPESISIKVD